MNNTTITILGQVPSKKNSKQVGTNRYTGKTFVTSSKIVKDWEKEALEQLRTVKNKFKVKVNINMHFYVKDNRRRDVDNMCSSCLDVLVEKQIIVDDCWQYLSIGSLDASIDRENPRVEIYIE